MEPELNNSSTALNHTVMGVSFQSTFDTFVVLIAVVIIAINGLVINLYVCKPFLKEVTNYFLVSLAVSDGLTGLLAIPIYVACTVSRDIKVCFSFDIAHRFTAFATVYHLLLITCDRYVAITRPFRHSSIFTATLAVVLLITVWCFSLFLPLIQLAWYDVDFLGDQSPEIRKYEFHYDITCLIIAFVVPVIVMTVAYAEMLRIVTRHARAIEATTREKQVLSKEKRAMVIFATMLLIYIVCWLSFFLSALNSDLDEHRVVLPRVLNDILFFFRFCTSVFNPLLYVFFKTDFKKALRETMTQFQCTAVASGFSLQSNSVSNNDDDSSPLARGTHTSKPVWSDKVYWGIDFF